MVVDMLVYSLVLPSSWFGVVLKKGGSNVVLTSLKTHNVTTRYRTRDGRTGKDPERNEAIPHGSAHKALKNQPGKWVLRGGVVALLPQMNPPVVSLA
jgi:hypothetical protein